MTTFTKNTTLYQDLKNTLLKQLKAQLTDNVVVETPQKLHITKCNEYFANTLVNNFNEIFKTPITDKTYDSYEVKVNYIGNSNDKWDYVMTIFNKRHYFICNDYKNCDQKLINDCKKGETLFNHNSLYICGFIKDGMRNYHNITIEYSEPDVECDENIPLFDTDECPVCMKKFGITETQQLIGNHPTKKY